MAFLKLNSRMKIQLSKTYGDITSLENLFAAWQEFVRGKRKKPDVQTFDQVLMMNLCRLRDDLALQTYQHSNYTAFNISDPKPRNIHKASVRDRVLHRAIYRQLFPFFERAFTADSFSGQKGKGVHRALNRFEKFGRQVGRNGTRTVWVLKCDIKKFFASIDHVRLSEILKVYIPDEGMVQLLEVVIDSFDFRGDGVGLPLGNLTSQLFCNVYMNEFDQYVKHKLKIRHYIRYADDFVFLSTSREDLLEIIPKISTFLNERLKLRLHPDKVSIKTLGSGVDFLGWVHFPDHRVLRTSTKKRMLKRIAQNPTNETLQSYLGLLGHGNSYKVTSEILGAGR